MAKRNNLYRIFESIKITKERLDSLQKTPNPKKPTSHAQALEEASRRLRTLVAEAIQESREEPLTLIFAFKPEIVDGILKDEFFQSIYPDAPLEIIEVLFKNDFPNATITEVKSINMRVAYKIKKPS